MLVGRLRRAYLPCLFLTACLLGCGEDISLDLSGGEVVQDLTDLRNLLPETSANLTNYFRLNSNVDEDGVATDTPVIVGTLDYVPGILGDAIAFNNDNDYIRFQPTVSTQYTFVAWVKHVTNGTSQYLLETRAFRIHNRGANRIQFELKASNSTIGRWKNSVAEAYPDNEWTFIAVSVDLTTTYPADLASIVKIYKNGLPNSVTVESTPTAPPYNNASTTGIIGNSTSLNRPTNGAYDEIAIYDTVLTPAQILQIYNAQKP